MSEHALEPTPSAIVDSAANTPHETPCFRLRAESASPVSWCLASEGIGEPTRLRIVAAYRRHGGSFGGTVSYAALARALRDVRRDVETRYPRVADELTHREDRLEMWLHDRRRRCAAGGPR